MLTISSPDVSEHKTDTSVSSWVVSFGGCPCGTLSSTRLTSPFSWCHHRGKVVRPPPDSFLPPSPSDCLFHRSPVPDVAAVWHSALLALPLPCETERSDLCVMKLSKLSPVFQMSLRQVAHQLVAFVRSLHPDAVALCGATWAVTGCFTPHKRVSIIQTWTQCTPRRPQELSVLGFEKRTKVRSSSLGSAAWHCTSMDSSADLHQFLARYECTRLESISVTLPYCLLNVF